MDRLPEVRDRLRRLAMADVFVLVWYMCARSVAAVAKGVMWTRGTTNPHDRYIGTWLTEQMVPSTVDVSSTLYAYAAPSI